MRENLFPWEMRQLNARLCARAGLLTIASTHRAGGCDAAVWSGRASNIRLSRCYHVQLQGVPNPN